MAFNHIQIFIDYLEQLRGLLVKIEASVGADLSILDARLTDDMFPLFTQVAIAAGFSLRACCPMANDPVVSFEAQQHTFMGLQTQLKDTIAYLKKLNNSKIEITKNHISDMAGPVKVTLPAMEFLHRFALPNFYFHISMVYAIAKVNGIAVSKGDYDGFHQYPAGFTFEDE
ncbi:MAG: DUF1993 family protein [Oceanospirillaceae bacterium]|nr:DUF1993 family protein [Oceanospirillaceae bacterium]